MHREVVDKQSGEDKRENDGCCQEPLTDSFFGFCDVVHGGEIWMQGSDYRGIWQVPGIGRGRGGNNQLIMLIVLIVSWFGTIAAYLYVVRCKR